MKVSSTLALLPGAGLVAAGAMPADSIAPRQVAALNLLQSRRVYTPSCKNGQDTQITKALEACEAISNFASGATGVLLNNAVLHPERKKAKVLFSLNFAQDPLTPAAVVEVRDIFAQMKTRCEEFRTTGPFVKCAASHKDCADGDNLYENGKDIFLEDNVATVCPVMFDRGQSLCGNYGPLTQKFIEVAFDAEVKRLRGLKAVVSDFVTKASIAIYAKEVQMLFCEYKIEAVQPQFHDRPAIDILDTLVFSDAQIEAVKQKFGDNLIRDRFHEAFVTKISKLYEDYRKNEEAIQAKLEKDMEKDREADKAAAEAEAEDEEKAKDVFREEGREKAKTEYDVALKDIKNKYALELKYAEDNHTEKYEELEKAKKLALEAELAKIEALNGDISALTDEKKEIEANSTQTKLELEKANSDLMAAKQELDDASKKLNETIEESRAKDNIIDDKTQQIKYLGETLDAERMHHDLRVQTDAQKLVDELEHKVRYLESALGYAHESLDKINNVLGGAPGGYRPTGGNSGGYGGGDLGGYGGANGGHGGKYPVEQIFNDDSEDCIEEEGDRNRHN